MKINNFSLLFPAVARAGGGGAREAGARGEAPHGHQADLAAEVGEARVLVPTPRVGGRDRTNTCAASDTDAPSGTDVM